MTKGDALTTKIWQNNKLHVEASYNEDGDLVIAGQDLNCWAGRDEYWITVSAADSPVLESALPAPEATDLIERLALHCRDVDSDGRADVHPSPGHRDRLSLLVVTINGRPPHRCANEHPQE